MTAGVVNDFEDRRFGVCGAACMLRDGRLHHADVVMAVADDECLLRTDLQALSEFGHCQSFREGYGANLHFADMLKDSQMRI